MKNYIAAQNKKYYRPDIDGLRAIAIIAVVLFHTYPSFLPGGFFGVDIFFVISGYLISGIIIRSLEANTFSFFDFYARRVRRIFPALGFLITSIAIVGLFVLSPKELKDLGHQIIYGSLFAENIYLIKHTGGYWDTATEMLPLMHLWTLAVEEQYYILYPLLCYVVFKAKKPLSLILIFLGIASFLLFIYQSTSSKILSFFSLQTRFWELCTGCLIAIAVQSEFFKGFFNRRVFVSSYFQNLTSVIGLLLITLGIVFATDDSLYRSLLTVFPVLGAVLVILSEKSWINKTVLSSKPFVFIGLVSYTWYLWHWPFLAISRNIRGGELPEFWGTTGLMALGFIFAICSYYLVETPIRVRPVSKFLVYNLCGVIGICSIGGLVIKKNEGFPSRLGESEAVVKNMVNKFPVSNDYARKTFGCVSFYCWAPNNSRPRIALVGDSHAHHLGVGLEALGQQPFLLIGQPGTPPVRNLLCLRHEEKSDYFMMERALDIVNNNSNIKTVILASRWGLFTYHSEVPYVWTKYSEIKDRYQIFEKLFSESIEKLINNGKNVIVVLDNPQLPSDPKKCIKTRPFLNYRGNCLFKKQDYLSREARTNEVISKVVKKI